MLSHQGEIAIAGGRVSSHWSGALLSSDAEEEVDACLRPRRSWCMPGWPSGRTSAPGFQQLRLALILSRKRIDGRPDGTRDSAPKVPTQCRYSDGCGGSGADDLDIHRMLIVLAGEQAEMLEGLPRRQKFVG